MQSLQVSIFNKNHKKSYFIGRLYSFWQVFSSLIYEFSLVLFCLCIFGDWFMRWQAKDAPFTSPFILGSIFNTPRVGMWNKRQENNACDASLPTHAHSTSIIAFLSFPNNGPVFIPKLGKRIMMWISGWTTESVLDLNSGSITL